MVNSNEMKRCPVVFNLADPWQKKLYEHTQKFTNFSAYIKRLIQRDMEGGTVQIKVPIELEEIDKALINGLI
ncbi:MAG: hypothetical protein Q8934_21440 [Bacillota bacterium]|nr:hypothetical protein [Bacillota bacterium]